jgi:hypothetical protein
VCVLLVSGTLRARRKVNGDPSGWQCNGPPYTKSIGTAKSTARDLPPPSMAPVYIAIKSQGRRNVPSTFTNRGIEGLTCGTLNRIVSVGLPAEKQLAYDGYVSNLSAFVFATTIGQRVFCNQLWFPFKLPVKHCIDLEFPDLFLAPKKILKTEDEKTEFGKTLNSQYEMKRGPQGESYIIAKPTFDTLRKLPPQSTLHVLAPSTEDGTSLHGLMTYIFALKCLSALLATHTYPAFQKAKDSTNSWSTDSEIYFQDGGYIPINETRNGAPIKYVPPLADQDKELVSDQTQISLWKFESSDYEAKKYNEFGAQGSVLVAKPAPLRPDVNVGSAASVPNLPVGAQSSMSYMPSDHR